MRDINVDGYSDIGMIQVWWCSVRRQNLET